MSLTRIIAKSIKKEDSTYFFENYTNQAKAVIQALHEHGYTIVLEEPNDNMIKAGVLAIKLGDVDARKLAKDIYHKMTRVK